MIETAVSTGMRISEILGLRWRCVDLNRGVIKVEERLYRGEIGEPKSERARRILPLGLLLESYRQHRPDTTRSQMSTCLRTPGNRWTTVAFSGA